MAHRTGEGLEVGWGFRWWHCTKGAKPPTPYSALGGFAPLDHVSKGQLQGQGGGFETPEAKQWRETRGMSEDGKPQIKGRGR